MITCNPHPVLPESFVVVIPCACCLEPRTLSACNKKLTSGLIQEHVIDVVPELVMDAPGEGFLYMKLAKCTAEILYYTPRAEQTAVRPGNAVQ